MSSTIRTGTAAIAWGRRQITNPLKNWTALCLQFTRMCFNVAAKYPDAKSAWHNALYKHRTTNAASIPAGVPVFWATPSRYDHIAISIGGGRCLSTDILRAGKVDEVSIDYLTRRWGATLLGWTEDINGVRVYTEPVVPTPTPAPTRPATATYLSKLKFGQRDSDSVKNLQKALNGHKLRGGQTLPVTGNYLKETDEEVRLCQAQHGFGPKVGTSDPAGRSNVGPKQAAHLGLPNIRS